MVWPGPSQCRLFEADNLVPLFVGEIESRGEEPELDCAGVAKFQSTEGW